MRFFTSCRKAPAWWPSSTRWSNERHMFTRERTPIASPAPTAGNIPWQLVQATPTTGSMVMNGVTYIQRVNTNAGVAPADPFTAATVAAKKQVRYSADYSFYTA